VTQLIRGRLEFGAAADHGPRGGAHGPPRSHHLRSTRRSHPAGVVVFCASWRC